MLGGVVLGARAVLPLASAFVYSIGQNLDSSRISYGEFIKKVEKKEIVRLVV